MQIENNSNARLVPNARFFQLKGSVAWNYELSSSEVYKLIPNQINVGSSNNMHCNSTWTIPLPFMSQVTSSTLLPSLITKPKQHYNFPLDRMSAGAFFTLINPLVQTCVLSWHLKCLMFSPHLSAIYLCPTNLHSSIPANSFSSNLSTTPSDHLFC